MVAEDSILPATAVQKKPAADLLSDYWDGWDSRKNTDQSNINQNYFNSTKLISLKSHGRFNRTLKFFITIYDRIGLIWSPLLAC